MENQIMGDIAASVVGSLTSSICIVDLAGTIVGMNRAWVEFSRSNGGDAERAYLGTNYFDVLRRSRGPAHNEAASVCAGLRSVLDGDAEVFQIEYPCHSPDELRWFLARVTPLTTREEPRGHRVGAVLSHMNITDRKKLELEYARLAWTDPLTELPNRRFFQTYADIELKRFQRFGGQASMLALDLNNFKLINDRYGHLAGDIVLKKFAACCKATVRRNDLFARIGGEEFVALLVGESEEGASELAERLRSAVERLRVKVDGATIPLTTSIGVTSLTQRDRSVSAILSRADKALYAAKHAGRNKVEILP